MTTNNTPGSLFSKRPNYRGLKFWIVGDMPLISHAWSEKAKREMMQKQTKSTRGGREARDPQYDFINSLYEMGEGTGIYGFPVTAIKLAMEGAAHKDKGIPKVTFRNAVFLHADMVRVRPALAGAICDMPLVRVWGAKPEMREDMVRVGKGLQKTASLAYRGQFFPWAIEVRGRFNADDLPLANIGFLVDAAGLASGIGEWRNERGGVFGAFHLGRADEASAWSAFAEGRGPLPRPQVSAEAAE